MYMTNLPDDVMIPDLLLVHVESIELTESAKRDALTWVRAYSTASPDLKDIWRRHIYGNIISCKTYGIPECVRLFTYVYQLIDELW